MINLPDMQDRTLAVTTFDKNIVVTAGAGTGKTTLLVDRIIYLLMREPDPLKITDIVALTFTNKAANEMKIRLKDRLQGLISTYDPIEISSSENTSNPPSPPFSKGGMGGFSHEHRITSDLIDRYRLSRDRIEERALDAISNLEKAQIGTMHSFAGYILRLYPIEAGIDPRFKEDDGSEFEEHFEREWEEWLDVELSADSPHRELWKVVLKQIGLESLKSFTKELCREIISIPLLKQNIDRKGHSHELQRWLEGEHEKVERLISKYTKSRKVEQLLTKAYDIFDGALSNREMPHIMDDGPSGPPPAGWKAQDYSEAKQTIKIAKRLSSVNDPFLNTLLPLLLPFIAQCRNRFVLSGHISFDGLLTSCHALLKTRPRVREELKRRFKAILVDEFQDTDPIQYEIILYLSESLEKQETDWRAIQLAQGKLFIVGDPKQSIYAFRRADIEAYARVVDRILSRQGGLQAGLLTSFRSHKGIIDVVNELFRQVIRERELLQPEYVDLVENPGREASLPLERVELRIIDGRGMNHIDASVATRLEAAAIGRWLKEEMLGIGTIVESKGSKVFLSPRHVAILFRKLTDVYEYIEVLRRYDIPYIVEGERHFYATQEVIDFTNLLKTIDNPFDRLALVGVLRSSLGGLSDREIYELNRLSLLDYRATEEVLEKASASPLLRNLYGLLSRLNREVGAKAVPDAIDYIFKTLPVLELAASSFHGEQAVANLLKIQKIAEALSDRSNLTLKGFTTLLEKRVTGLEEEGESLLTEESVDAVRILSIHKAKGLEFPVVILAGMHSSPRGGEDQVSVMYDWSSHEIGFKVDDLRNLAAVMLHERNALRDQEEQKRLLYVAMTRARECLVLSGTLYGRMNRGSFLSLLNEVIGGALGDKSIEEIAIGEGRIRQIVIDSNDCMPQYGTRRVRKPEVRSQGSHSPYPSPSKREVNALAELWTSRGNRYQAINDKRLFMTPSMLEEDRDRLSEARFSGETPMSRRLTRERENVIPAQAGIQNAGRGLDSHLRGNDGYLEGFSGEKAEIREKETTTRERPILIGTLAHYILEHWDFENDPSLFKDAVENACLKFTSPRFAGDILSVKEELEGMFDSFSISPAYEELRKMTIVGQEIPFTMPWDGQVMDGVIDLIYRDGGRLYIADYKTDRITEADIENKISEYLLSMRIYKEAVRRCLGEEVAGCRLIFLRLGRSIGVTPP